MKLYGVQNHYSIISREWEQNGLLDWCKENGISFWAWAVLEEGMLVDPRVKTKGSIMKLIFNRQKRKMRALYQSMIQISERHAITVSQVAVAFCAAKGIVPFLIFKTDRSSLHSTPLGQSSCIISSDLLMRLRSLPQIRLRPASSALPR